MKKLKQWVFERYFQSEKNLLELLVKDNKELQGIALEQIQQIQELESDVAKLDYAKEDLEIRVEAQSDTISKLEEQVNDLDHELSVMEREREDLEWSYENEIENYKEEIHGFEQEVEQLEDRIDQLEFEMEEG
jgi:chromosome segregation ATPase